MDRLILISGSSGDIATAVIKLIAERLTGFEIILTYNRNKPKVVPDNSSLYKVDFKDRGQCEEFCKNIDNKHITHFVQLQGGLFDGGSIEDTNSHDLMQSVELNLLSTVCMLRSVLPKMKINSFGRIVLMSTASASYGGGEKSFAYGLSKHGIYFLTKYLAKHYSKHNIITNCVSPGFIGTKFHLAEGGRDKDFLDRRAESVRLGRAGDAEDVAKLIFNLCFENEFIVGENIKIDGADFI